MPSRLINPSDWPPVSAEAIASAMPRQAMFAGKGWLSSPRPLGLDARFVRFLEQLGHRLLKFQQASDLLYRQSVRGKAPGFVARQLDAGKPEALLEVARSEGFRGQVPGVIRPDILIGEESIAITELDAVPGGIGLTAWLNATYTSEGRDVIGGADGMLDGFESVLSEGDILVSPEAATYRPEMEWLAARINERAGAERLKVAGTDSWISGAPSVYRFFELFDLPNVPCAEAVFAEAVAGRTRLTPPPKPWIEEKLWMAYLHMAPLGEFWRRELGSRYFQDLRDVVPMTLPVDPAPLPPHAVLRGLDAHSWEEVAGFSQKQRDLILKVSGFSEMAWGSRGVVLGSDVSGEEWAGCVREAVDAFDSSPRVLQEFRPAAVIEHPYHDPVTGGISVLEGRVRLCPYYFTDGTNATLRGVLATICPADKKLIHGMSDAILCPCAVA